MNWKVVVDNGFNSKVFENVNGHSIDIDYESQVIKVGDEAFEFLRCEVQPSTCEITVL